ncbi:MAG: hypothetical protein JW939_04245 [Candidatus Thermoplasmatota archaeon]|nr:hypothetical protein [Candidatus Thermoplasmatota archaeon]
MTRSSALTIGLLCATFSLVALLFSFPANADSEEYKALIIVSDYMGTSQDELVKAVAFHEYLERNGYRSEDITFLTSEDVYCRDDMVGVANVIEAFQRLIDGSKQKTVVNIYISDNAHSVYSESFYRFADGKVSCQEIIGWIDQTDYRSLNYITLGNHSGTFGQQLAGTNRVIMSSMREDEEHMIDRFNITRSLSDPDADLNNDGMVSFVEAFLKEKEIVMEYGQDPQLWLLDTVL